jgi:NADH dehydrogenase FAD-containing subunit
VLTETKLVKVEKTLQVSSHPAIFAVGDIIDWKEQKQAAKANGHGPVVAANVLSFLGGRPVRKEYGGLPEAIMITNGKVRKRGPLLILPSLTHVPHHRAEDLGTSLSFGVLSWVTSSRRSSSRRVYWSGWFVGNWVIDCHHESEFECRLCIYMSTNPQNVTHVLAVSAYVRNEASSSRPKVSNFKDQGG